jgi:hypothetical protein
VIWAVLAACHGWISGGRQAVAKLGIPHQTFESKIKALLIDNHSSRAP